MARLNSKCLSKACNGACRIDLFKNKIFVQSVHFEGLFSRELMSKHITFIFGLATEFFSVFLTIVEDAFELSDPESDSEKKKMIISSNFLWYLELSKVCIVMGKDKVCLRTYSNIELGGEDLWRILESSTWVIRPRMGKILGNHLF